MAAGQRQPGAGKKRRLNFRIEEAGRASFRVDSERWRAIEAAMDRPAEIKPKLVALFERPRPE